MSEENEIERLRVENKKLNEEKARLSEELRKCEFRQLRLKYQKPADTVNSGKIFTQPIEASSSPAEDTSFVRGEPKPVEAKAEPETTETSEQTSPPETSSTETSDTEAT